MKTGDELYSEMRTLIDTGIKKMEKPQIQQAPDNSPEAINKLKSLFTPDITNALKITWIQVLEGYKIQIPGWSFKIRFEQLVVH